ncbi:NAD(P)H-dependent oxidoreductase [Streptomyces sp. NPDC048057]|uniref:NADPH-dependent FMN reductase n=1 Tax=Streptomyces sp. NPDC048057 TaxID=3155628 RepID=UPI0033C3114D
MEMTTRENPQLTPARPRSGPDSPALKLAVIVASNRSGRFAPVIVRWFLRHAQQRDDLDVTLVDLAELDLPSALGAAAPEGLAAVSATLARADAFVVVTPEYNHSYPAALKSLIDWHYAQWHAKPVAFVSYGGVSGGLRAVEHLRQVFAELHAATVRDTVSFHNAHGDFDAEGRHKDPTGCDAAAKALLDRLTWWAHALRDARRERPYTV